MIATTFEKGRRLFTCTSLLMIGVAVLHAWGSSQPVPADLDPVVQAMQNTVLSLGMGMSPSLWDVHSSLTYTMSITLFLLGALGLTLAATTETTARVLSRVSAVMAVGCGLMTALYYITRIPPPLISLGALTLLWGISMRTTRLA